MDKEWDTRNAFGSLVDYLQANYRTHMNSRDYEYLNFMFDNYSFGEIVKAVDYCQKQNTDSLVYLLKTLKFKYYENQNIPKWMNQKLEKDPLTNGELQEITEMYKEFYEEDAR